MKSFKDLFIKDEDDEQEESEPQKSVAFPVDQHTSKQSTPSTSSKNNPYIDEILTVYEEGLDKLNMPGYDFYDFYSAIIASGEKSESVFKMAFQMGKTLDKTITPQKLVSDAEFYISKINDVHQSYSHQGQKKLKELENQTSSERDKLTEEAKQIENDITRMKQQILEAESHLEKTKAQLNKIGEINQPEQNEIKLKLSANDEAMHISIKKLSFIKEHILKFLK